MPIFKKARCTWTNRINETDLFSTIMHIYESWNNFSFSECTTVFWRISGVFDICTDVRSSTHTCAWLIFLDSITNACDPVCFVCSYCYLLSNQHNVCFVPFIASQSFIYMCMFVLQFCERPYWNLNRILKLILNQLK